MNERMKFEAWLRSIWTAGYDCRRGPGGDSYASGEAQNYWTAWQAAIASQAPRQALSDAEIDTIYVDYTGTPSDRNSMKVARAIEAASGPNAALVAALERAMWPIAWTPEMDDAWHKAIPDVPKAFRDLRSAALRTAGVEVA